MLVLSWKPIVEYMEDRFSDYFDQETRVERQVRIPDRRVHCCLYFIAPTAHGYAFAEFT